MLYVYAVSSNIGTLYASRTISLKIQDWARIEEIMSHRSFKDLKEVMTYIIRAEHSMILAKSERDNQYLPEVN